MISYSQFQSYSLVHPAIAQISKSQFDIYLGIANSATAKGATIAQLQYLQVLNILCLASKSNADSCDRPLKTLTLFGKYSKQWFGTPPTICDCYNSYKAELEGACVDTRPRMISGLRGAKKAGCGSCAPLIKRCHRG